MNQSQPPLPTPPNNRRQSLLSWSPRRTLRALAGLITASLSAQTTLKEFTNSATEGSNPVAPLAIRADGVMFGATNSGGANNLGTLFSVNADGSGYTVLRHLDNSSGYNPNGGLLLASDGRLYGAATWGGTGGAGTIFRLEADGSNFTVLRALNGALDGQAPIAGLTQGPDGRLYGAASLGGPDWGTVFRINTDGSGFTRLHSFGISVNDPNGTRPYGTPAFGADGRIYGTTWTGGSANSQGVIYRMDADGNNYTVLFTFTGAATGEQPYAGLRIAPNGTLYGTTNFGGAYGKGVVYRINPDGSSFIVLKHLGSSAPEGNGPYYAVPALLGGRLFAAAGFGGFGGVGGVIGMALTGADFKVETSFSGANGGNPLSGVRVGNDGFVYGTARTGGSTGGGVIFRLPFYSGDFSAAAIDPILLVSQWTAGNAQFLPGTRPYWSVTSGGGQLRIALAPNNNDYLADGPHVQTKSTLGITGDFVATVTIDNSANNGGSAGFFANFPSHYAGFGFFNSGISFNTSIPGKNTNTGSALTSGTFQLVRSGITLTAQFKPVGATTYTVLQTFTDPGIAGNAKFDLTCYAGPGRTAGLSTAFSNFVVILPPASAPVVTSGSASGTVGANLSYQIVATSSPTSYAATGLPSGLSLNTTTGTITGATSLAGTYTIGLSATNTGGTGTGTLTLTIGKATGSIMVGDLTQTYDGTVKSASATTAPPGLAVIFNYLGGRINAGSYSFIASISDNNFAGSVTGTLVIDRAAAVVTLGNLTQPYDGTPRTVGVTTAPIANLPVSITYNGTATPPTAVGSYAIVATVTDPNYSGSGNGTLTITDTTAPVLSLPVNLTLEATNSAGAVATFTASATDNVDGTVPVTLSAASGSNFPLGVTAVTASATDAAGNLAKGTFTITVRDTTAPTIATAANLTVEATSPSGAVVNFALPAATDAVSTPAVSALPASGSVFPLGSSTVTVKATDGANNSATSSFSVTVRDTTAPAIVAPANIIAEATTNAGAIVDYGAATVTDVVGVNSVTYSRPSGAAFALGDNTVVITATDQAGNASTASFVVTVRDTTAPTFTSVPGNITAEATGPAGAIVNYAPASASDAVGVQSITYSQPSGSTFAIGVTTVVVTARDQAGNTRSASFTVTVGDSTAPVISSLTPSNAALWPPNHQMVAVRLNVVASDAVGYVLRVKTVTSSEPDNGLGDGDTPNDVQFSGADGDLAVNLRAERSGNGNGRTYTITVEARDAAGNTSTRTCAVVVPKSQGGK